MKRLIERLIAAIRAVLSRFGFSEGAASSSGEALTEILQSQPSSPVSSVEDAAPALNRPQDGGFDVQEVAAEAGGEGAAGALRPDSDAAPSARSAPSTAAAEAPLSAEDEDACDSAQGASAQKPSAVQMPGSAEEVDDDSTEACDGEELRSVAEPACDQVGAPGAGDTLAAGVQGSDFSGEREDLCGASNAESSEPQPVERTGDGGLAAEGGQGDETAVGGAREEAERTPVEIGRGGSGDATNGEPPGSPQRVGAGISNGGGNGEAHVGDQPSSNDDPLRVHIDENERSVADSDSSAAASGVGSGVSEDQSLRQRATAGCEDSPPGAQEWSGGSAIGQQPLRPAAEGSLEFEGREKTASARRPAPAEDADEYKAAVRDISTVDQEYARWNSAVVEQMLLAKPASEDVYLSITPRALAAAFAEAGFDVLTPEEAEQRFASAVSSVYGKRVLGHSAHLRVLRRCGVDGSPDCTAFLAASVLAAYRMQSDEEASGNAYYRRLADLLGCGMSGAHPVGFSATAFESLWVFLGNWLNQAHGRRFAAPGADVGLRRFVALPLAHVPLRSLDMEKLPGFFAWAGYEPGSRIPRGRLLADLRLWQRSKSALTQTGADALLDDRSEAVVAQVSTELESWDGSFSESVSRRSAVVEIQFDVVQRQPILAYLPRRPPGFPSVFDDGEHVFEASDDGWYDPAPLRPSDGEALASGFDWRSVSNHTQFALRRPEARVVALTPSSNYSGFLSSRRLLRGVRCSVLCRRDLIGTVEEYLSEIARQRLSAVSDPRLPEGWSIIRDFAAQLHIQAPEGLEALEIDPNIDLLVSGGLRIGRRWSWVAGAPPRILVTGMEVGEEVKVNGAAVEVSGGGELMVNGLLGQPGDYLIEAGRARRRLEVLRPQISVQRGAAQAGGADDRRTVRVALPQGSWMLIGSSPGEICTSRSAFRGGALASCPFHPIWAVQVGSGPGAEVAVVGEPEPPRGVDVSALRRSTGAVCTRWAGVIYDAAVRRPRFIGVNGMAAGKRAELVWKQYAAAAKAIKRRSKRR